MLAQINVACGKAVEIRAVAVKAATGHRAARQAKHPVRTRHAVGWRIMMEGLCTEIDIKRVGGGVAVIA